MSHRAAIPTSSVNASLACLAGCFLSPSLPGGRPRPDASFGQNWSGVVSSDPLVIAPCTSPILTAVSAHAPGSRCEKHALRASNSGASRYAQSSKYRSSQCSIARKDRNIPSSHVGAPVPFRAVTSAHLFGDFDVASHVVTNHFALHCYKLGFATLR